MMETLPLSRKDEWWELDTEHPWRWKNLLLAVPYSLFLVSYWAIIFTAFAAFIGVWVWIIWGWIYMLRGS